MMFEGSAEFCRLLSLVLERGGQGQGRGSEGATPCGGFYGAGHLTPASEPGSLQDPRSLSKGSAKGSGEVGGQEARNGHGSRTPDPTTSGEVLGSDREGPSCHQQMVL